MAKKKQTHKTKSFHSTGLGKNKNLTCDLYQGDCLNKLKRIPSGSVDLVIIDPPYLLNTKGGGGAFATRQFIRDIAPLGDGFDFQVLEQIERVQKKTNIYIFCNTKLLLPLIAHYQSKNNLSLNILCWQKSNPIPQCGNKYLDDIEYVLFVREKSVKVYGTYHTKSKIYKSPTNKKDKKLFNHPTPKPVQLLENYIQNSSLKGHTVLDCFMGSGSTGVAALKQNRHFIGIELNSTYFKTAKNRILQKIKTKNRGTV